MKRSFPDKFAFGVVFDEDGYVVLVGPIVVRQFVFKYDHSYKSYKKNIKYNSW